MPIAISAKTTIATSNNAIGDRLESRREIRLEMGYSQRAYQRSTTAAPGGNNATTAARISSASCAAALGVGRTDQHCCCIGSGHSRCNGSAIGRPKSLRRQPSNEPAEISGRARRRAGGPFRSRSEERPPTAASASQRAQERPSRQLTITSRIRDRVGRQSRRTPRSSASDNASAKTSSPRRPAERKRCERHDGPIAGEFSAVLTRDGSKIRQKPMARMTTHAPRMNLK